MTEEDWLTCAKPREMLTSLQGKRSDRKFRLYACASARRVWDVLTDERVRALVTTAELWLDGSAPESALSAVYEACSANDVQGGADGWGLYVTAALRTAFSTPRDEKQSFHRRLSHGSDFWALPRYVASTKARQAIQPYVPISGAGPTSHPVWIAAFATENRHQADLIRDIFGNPFRTPTIRKAWREWNDGTAVTLAKRVAASQDFGLLPILADALEDAGCDDTDVLNHCRGGGPHGRGCWVVDLVLGKE